MDFSAKMLLTILVQVCYVINDALDLKNWEFEKDSAILTIQSSRIPT